MKIITILVFIFSFFSATLSQVKTGSGQKSRRVEKVINSDWTFNYFPSESADKGYEAASYNDSRWPAISIPHTWNTYETTGELHPFIMNAAESDNPYWWTGWGWYRKRFSINPAYSDRKVFIEFEGVQKYCKVWLNGRYLGDHKGGYGSFDFDITDLIKQGGDNVLAVAVNNRQKDKFSIPPMAAGNFNVYGGIYRDVTIVLKDRLYIPMQGSASHEGGTFVTTPKVTEKEALIRVQTWVKNEYTQKKNCTLKTSVFDASGRMVQQFQSTAEIEPLQIYRFDQTSNPVKMPRLWSPSDPYMYRIQSEVITGAQVTDIYSSPLGFRWFSWDYKENILYVNGKKTMLYGGNRHQDYPWLGDAIPKWITQMDLSDIDANLNYNFMRTSHYPNDKLVYDLADKYGIVISEETPSIKNQEFSPAVQEQQMKEMIRRDRNHPSIMFWSMGNETNHAVDSRHAVAEDTTRIIAARRVSGGSAGEYVRFTEANLLIEDLLRCTVRGWYNKDVRDNEPADGQHCGTEEHHQNMLIASGKLGTGNLSTWLYADHGADREYLNAPLLHVNPKGYVDLYRVPKYGYYLWQAVYGTRPMVFVQPHFWRSQYLGLKKDIVITSNCEKVELKVNGVSRGSLVPDAGNFHTVVFRDITIENGTIEAVGMKGGKPVTNSLTMAGDPAKIVLKASVSKISADRASVVIITADIHDSKGNHVYGATNTVRWSVSGPATLAGPNIYESEINKHHSMKGTWYIDMPVSNVIRSTGKPGKIRVNVSSTGLASGSVEIDASEPVRDNSVIVEPVLSGEGRMPVEKAISAGSRPVSVPKELNNTAEELVFIAPGKAAYAKAIRDYIFKNNPAADTATIEFRTLADLYAVHLLNNGGRIIADDYNFSIEHYNRCRSITKNIPSTKLPELFKEGLKTYYAESIIRNGSEKSSVDEMTWLNWIPSGGTVVVSSDKKNPSFPKGTITTGTTGLSDIIALVHPGFTSFSEEARERALTFISKMNPYVKTNEMSESDAEGKKITKISYIVETGKPILIPLLKFIAE